MPSAEPDRTDLPATPVARPPVARASTRLLDAATGGGEITRTVLPGGLRVVSEAMPGVRNVTVGVWVPVGSRDETPSLAGSSHFLEHLLFKGTAERTALDIARAMDDVGGEFNAFTEKEHTCYYATVLDRDLDVAIDIVADVVLNAVIAEVDVDVERQVVLEEIAMRDDDPSDLVHDEFSSALFGDTPLGRLGARAPRTRPLPSPQPGRRALQAALHPRRHGRLRGRQRRALPGGAAHPTLVRRAPRRRRGATARPARTRRGLRAARSGRSTSSPTTPSRPTCCSAATASRGTMPAGTRWACSRPRSVAG